MPHFKCVAHSIPIRPLSLLEAEQILWISSPGAESPSPPHPTHTSTQLHIYSYMHAFRSPFPPSLLSWSNGQYIMKQRRVIFLLLSDCTFSVCILKMKVFSFPVQAGSQSGQSRTEPLGADSIQLWMWGNRTVCLATSTAVFCYVNDDWWRCIHTHLSECACGCSQVQTDIPTQLCPTYCICIFIFFLKLLWSACIWLIILHLSFQNERRERNMST